jgi:CXXX repeat modification system protein
MGDERAAKQERIGVVSREERDLIQTLHVRKTGLAELFASVTRMDDELKATQLYERLVEEMGTVALEYQNWWDAMVDKYGWERPHDHGWRIDFDSCSIYLERE